MTLADQRFELGIATRLSTLQFERNGDVNHGECDAGADCGEQDEKEGLLTDCNLLHDSSSAVIATIGGQ
jgi:hypothetical protein